ncbi:hypothetical protein [Variovorax defluvii]
MNTDRDNFHDWARDKPDTAFSPISRYLPLEHKAGPVIRWGRLLIGVLLGAGLVVGFKWVAGL